MKLATSAAVYVALFVSVIATHAAEEPNLLRDPGFETFGKPDAIWKLVVNKQTAATAERVEADGEHKVVVTIPAAAAQVWHIQFQQNNVPLVKGVQYTLRFTASAEQESPVTLLIQQEEKPYAMIGVSQTETVGPASKEYVHTFVAKADEPNTKISLALGAATGRVTVSRMSLTQAKP